MARSIWSGAISFGLIHIPVELMAAEKRVDLRFHLVDSRDNARIRYERVNAETGDEVPWKDVVKAFEFKKDSYVVLEEKDFKAAAPESAATIDIEGFVSVDEIGPEYLERPYFLVPGKRAEKGYVLLRETLKAKKRVGIARIVIRTREHLTMLLPQGDALMLILLRFPQELVPVDTYAFPGKSLRAHRIGDKEIEMAERLVESMSAEWQPKDYRDDFRAKLGKLIQSRVRSKGARIKAKSVKAPETQSDKVIDFMALLKKSIDSKHRSPARARAAKKPPVKRRAQKRG